MSEWIIDRRPTEGDCAAPHYCVYDSMGHVVHWKLVGNDVPWKPVPKCKPYVKPKRWDVVYLHDTNEYCVVEYNRKPYRSYSVPTREAAERIAAIYEEVMP